MSEPVEKESPPVRAGMENPSNRKLSHQAAAVNVFGFIKAIRNPEVMELIGLNHHAFVLLFVIAWRARWKAGFNRHGLAPGEAFIGDYAALNMSEREYRTAKQALANHGFATFKATNKGTIATLCGCRAFDINLEPTDGQIDRQPTGSRRAADGQPTTNEEGKKAKNGKKEKFFAKNSSSLVKLWEREFLAVKGYSYVPEETDLEAASQLLTSTGWEPQAIVGVAKSAWELARLAEPGTDQYYWSVRASTSLLSFKRRFNDIQDELERG